MQEYSGGPLLPAPQYPAPKRRNRLKIAGIVVALAITLGVGAVLGATYLSTAQAASGPSASTANTSNTFTQGRGFATGPSGTPPAQGQGQCESLTVSSVSGATITAKASDGTTVTVTTTSSTTYTKSGAAATASDVKAGVTISVMGTHNSDSSITATSIDIR